MHPTRDTKLFCKSNLAGWRVICLASDGNPKRVIRRVNYVSYSPLYDNGARYWCIGPLLRLEGGEDFGDIVVIVFSTPIKNEYPDGRIAYVA
jgi:hypothetical protein